MKFLLFHQIKYQFYRLLCNIAFCKYKEFFKEKKQKAKLAKDNFLVIKSISNNFKCSFHSQLYRQNFILFDYKFVDIFKLYGVNIGDFIQTIAVENIINRLYPEVSLRYCNRDNLFRYNGDKAFTIMQGWFSHDNQFIPNNSILPVYIGTHITSEMRSFIADFNKYYPNYFKRKIVGCRDKDTLYFLQKIGIDSYFSRCLTLTIGKRQKIKGQDKVFIVNVPERYHKYLPESILKNSEIINQRQVDIGFDDTKYSDTNTYFNMAHELLNKYSNEARLIITTALHCACPCIVMGIPVILIKLDSIDSRFSTLDGIIKIYNIDDLKSGNIDYETEAPDIEDLKQLLLRNTDLSIKQAFNEDVDINELNNIRNEISNYRVIQ